MPTIIARDVVFCQADVLVAPHLQPPATATATATATNNTNRHRSAYRVNLGPFGRVAIAD